MFVSGEKKNRFNYGTSRNSGRGTLSAMCHCEKSHCNITNSSIVHAAFIEIEQCWMRSRNKINHTHTHKHNPIEASRKKASSKTIVMTVELAIPPTTATALLAYRLSASVHIFMYIQVYSNTILFCIGVFYPQEYTAKSL